MSVFSTLVLLLFSNCGGSCAGFADIFGNAEPNASLPPNLHEGGPSHAIGENVYTLSMFFLLKVLEIQER
jgi:hypothetical protein